MLLKQYLRNVFAEKIRPNNIKKKCECCGATTDLHLHHADIKMKDIVVETLLALNLELKTVEQYTETELFNIKCYFIGRHQYCQFATLCQKCHQDLHMAELPNLDIRMAIKQYKKQLQKQQNAAKKHEQDVQRKIEILENNCNKKLDIEELKNIIKQLKIKKENGKYVMSIDCILPYIVELGYNIQENIETMYCWSKTVYIISKIENN